MKGLAMAGLLLALLAGACSTPSGQQNHVKEGVALIDSGKWEEAIAEFDVAIQEEPGNASAYSNRGYAYSMLGQLERAIADYDKAIALDPAHAAAYTNRAIAYSKLGKHARAKTDCDKSIEIDPTSAAAYDARGLALAGLGEYELAIADYGMAIQLDASRTSALNNRAIAYSELGQDERALADFDTAIELETNPIDLAGLYLNRGITYANLGDQEEAKADYEKALSLTSDPTLTAKIQESLDRVSWSTAWERGVCAAYTNIGREVDVRDKAFKLAPPEGKGYAAAAVKFEAAAALAAKAIAQLEGVPSWPPGEPWRVNLLTQATGYLAVDNLMVEASQAAADDDLVTALLYGTTALELPAYEEALQAADAQTEVLKNVYEETGFLCPT
jgi:Tfp pilus assembly protein PilF